MHVETVFKGIRVKPWLKQIEGEAPVFGKFEIFNMAQGMAIHAAARHSVIARNVANADTPGYRSQDIASFAESYRPQSSENSLRLTRPGHMDGLAGAGRTVGSQLANDPSSPNGNSVSLETEMVKASETRHQHEMALSIYSTSLEILRASLGRR